MFQLVLDSFEFLLLIQFLMLAEMLDIFLINNVRSTLMLEFYDRTVRRV
jgi:hypothetical protein